MPSTLPTTPTAEISRSARIVCTLPLASSMVTETESSPFSTFVTLVEVRITMPCFSNRLRASAAISASSTGRICGSTSITVTSTPIVR